MEVAILFYVVPPRAGNPTAVATAILAGGKSSRMGRNKSGLRLEVEVGSKTLLGLIRETVQAAGFSSRVIRRDLVPPCGPLAGILTALRTSSAESEIFLACDMPFVSAETLRRLASLHAKLRQPIFALSTEGAGFPCILPVSCLSVVESQIDRKQFSLQKFAKACGAGTMALPPREALNLNTPEDLAQAKKLLPKRESRPPKPKNPLNRGL
jgi:molybdopterin-guanine dinucleotide biosynthesis protein A